MREKLSYLAGMDASAYEGLTEAQTAMLWSLFTGSPVRACTAAAGPFTATVGVCKGLPLPYLEVVADNPRRAKAVRGRIVTADLLAAWVTQIEPL